MIAALREWADIHEKSVNFMDDDEELAAEALAETALLRRAADELEAMS